MKYKLAQAENLDQLEKEVREALAGGWKPQGGISASVTLDAKQPSDGQRVQTLYAQAMVKET